MESLCSLKNPVLYKLPNACYQEQFPHFLRLILHAEEYGTSLSENVLNLVHAKRIHFIDIQELIDAEKIESRTIHDLVQVYRDRRQRKPFAQSSPRLHHQVVAAIAVDDNAREREAGIPLGRRDHFQRVLQLNGIKDRLYIMVSVGAAGNDAQPQIDFGIGKSYHRFDCFSRFSAKLTILVHIANPAAAQKHKNSRHPSPFRLPGC